MQAVVTGLLVAAASTLIEGAAAAQTPPYIGALSLEPGLTIGQCLTAASNTDGATVSIQPCTYDTDQQWTFANGAVTIFGGSKCLDVPNGNNADGTLLQIWTCTAGNPNQQWSYTYADTHGPPPAQRDNRLANTKSKCVDLPGGNTASGTGIGIYGCTNNNKQQIWNAGYNVNNLPDKSQGTQFGTNKCGTASSQDSDCQTAYLNSATDFCLWAPPTANSTIGDTEREEVSWCTLAGRGTRVIPDGALKGVHFVRTPNYVQVTGVGDFTFLNIAAGDAGGELDNRGADGDGNPAGGLVYGNTFGNGVQYHEWTSFISDSEFCFRACVGADATVNCNHIYDTMGCYWVGTSPLRSSQIPHAHTLPPTQNMPANYDPNVYETCDGDDDLPMGVYGTSTWYQGVSPTPPPHPVASSSNCVTVPTVSAGTAPAAKRSVLPSGHAHSYGARMMHRRVADGVPLPTPTPPPVKL
ncbi:hypothetical protein H0H92_003709 [Tricholoma furcatifolium]|nr:hypothetical protein H0H92_003709 [Tricholoma furcatifolium]